MKAEQNKMKIEMEKSKNKLNGCNIQVSELIAVVERQDQII